MEFRHIPIIWAGAETSTQKGADALPWHLLQFLNMLYADPLKRVDVNYHLTWLNLRLRPPSTNFLLAIRDFR